jgi:hypothetical protein
MSLTDAQRSRYARHLLLPELAEPGQARLVASRVCFDGAAEAGAREVAQRYLTRAGVQEDVARGVQADLVDDVQLAQLAGRPELIEAARALAGALSAVEAIKALAGIGSAGTWGLDVSLATEEA